MTAFSELRRIRGRLKIPDNKKTTPTTEERLYNTDGLFFDGINAELARKVPPMEKVESSFIPFTFTHKIINNWGNKTKTATKSTYIAPWW